LGLAASADEAVGIRQNDVAVSEGQNDLGTTQLKALGGIKGKAQLKAAVLSLAAADSSLLGGEVYIAGSQFISKMTGAGDFSLDGVPSGTHQVVVEKDGYKRIVLDGFKVAADQTAQIPAVSMEVDLGAKGALQFVSQEGTTNKFTFNVSSKDAVTMKVYASDQEEAAKWTPYALQVKTTWGDQPNLTEHGGEVLKLSFCVKFRNDKGITSDAQCVVVMAKAEEFCKTAEVIKAAELGNYGSCAPPGGWANPVTVPNSVRYKYLLDAALGNYDHWSTQPNTENWDGSKPLRFSMQQWDALKPFVDARDRAGFEVKAKEFLGF